jgi:hypothetical protein
MGSMISNVDARRDSNTAVPFTPIGTRPLDAQAVGVVGEVGEAGDGLGVVGVAPVAPPAVPGVRGVGIADDAEDADVVEAVAGTGGQVPFKPGSVMLVGPGAVEQGGAQRVELPAVVRQ